MRSSAANNQATWAFGSAFLNSAAVPLFCEKIPLFGRFNSAVERRSGIGSQVIDLAWD
jgi:hypothetical protein